MIHSFLTTTPGDMARVCMLPAMVLLIAAGATVVNLLTPKPKPEHIHQLDLDKAKVVEGTEVTAVLGGCAKEGCSAKIRLDVPRIRTGLVPFPRLDGNLVRTVANDALRARHRDN